MALAIEVDSGSTTAAGAEHYTRAVLVAVQALLAGDATQWQTLVAEVHALALAVCQRRQAARGADFASNVALRVIERLRKEDYKALRRFMELRDTYPALAFETWTRGIINNALIDEVRSLPETSRKRVGKRRELQTRTHVIFEDEQHAASASLAHSGILDARRVLRWIHDADFPLDQKRALLFWLNGHSIADCARQLDLDETGTRRLLRAARQRLRRQFQEKS